MPELLKGLKKAPLHTFVFHLGVILFMIAHNYEQVFISETYRSVICGWVAVIIIFIAVFGFLRSGVKSGVFTTVFVIAFFSYGILYSQFDSLNHRGLWPFHIHRFLMPAYAVFFTCLLVYMKFTKRDFVTANQLMNVFTFLFIGFNIFNVSLNVVKSKSVDATENESQLSSDTHTQRTTLPNIYYFILDGYANHEVLQQYYNYDNSAFRGFLERNSFLVIDSSRSNYYNTLHSLSTTLNMRFLQPGDKANQMIANNRWFDILKSNGYYIRVLSSGYAVTSNFYNADEIIAPDGPNEFERTLLQITMLSIDDVFGFIPYHMIRSQLQKTKDIFSTPPDKSRSTFTFVHIVCPHPPYVFDKKGQRNFRMYAAENFWEPKVLYTSQLEYLTRQIETVLDNIVKNDTSAVVLLQSDHGPFVSAASIDSIFDARSKILNAVRGPEDLKVQFYNNITSVNTFTCVSNYFFTDSIVLLPDSLAGKGDFLKDGWVRQVLLKPLP